MKNISVQEFQKKLASEANNQKTAFIDVRSETEYAENHIEGVRNVPLNELEKHLVEFNNKQTIYIHCLSGGRSKLAIDILQSKGASAELINVDGGLLAWYEAGFPIVS